MSRILPLLIALYALQTELNALQMELNVGMYLDVVQMF